MKESVYCPVQKCPDVARLVSGLRANNGTLGALEKQASLLNLDWDELGQLRCNPDEAFSDHCQKLCAWEEETLAAVVCSDNTALENATGAEFGQLAARFRSRSAIMGGSLTELLMYCVGWRLRAAWRQDGMKNLRTCAAQS